MDDPEARLCGPSLLKSALVCQLIKIAAVVSLWVEAGLSASAGERLARLGWRCLPELRDSERHLLSEVGQEAMKELYQRRNLYQVPSLAVCNPVSCNFQSSTRSFDPLRLTSSTRTTLYASDWTCFASFGAFCELEHYLYR